jgi:hypothetical protein
VNVADQTNSRSTDGLDKYRAGIAEWEAVRAKGMLLFLLVRGALRQGVPIGIGLTAIAAIFQFGLKLNDRLITSWEGPLVFFGFGIFMGVRRAMIEWNLRENEYREWKTYEGGGNVLGLRD